MKYLLANNVRFLPIAKTGSAMIAHAIFKTHHREAYDRTLAGLHKPEGLAISDLLLQGICPSEREPTAPVITAIRNPVDRFLSACAFLQKMNKGRTVDEHLDAVEQGKADQHLRPQSESVKAPINLYKFPEHLPELAIALGLDETWKANATDPETKPDLTTEQLARVEAIYADDIALFNSITEPGTLHTAPVPEPEPLPVPARVAAYKVLGHLASFGVSETALEDYIKDTTLDPVEQIKALNELKRTQFFEVDHPLINAVAAHLNITDVPQFFRDAERYKYTK